MLYIFFIILLAFIAQIQVLPILGFRLDLLLFVTIYYGFIYGWRFGAGIGLLVGLAQDIFSGGMLGLGPIGLVVCGLLAGYCKRMLILRYWIVRVGLVLILSILNLLIYFGLTNMFSQTRIYMVFRNNWLVVSLGNTIFAGAIFWLMDRYG